MRVGGKRERGGREGGREGGGREGGREVGVGDKRGRGGREGGEGREGVNQQVAKIHITYLRIEGEVVR